MNPRSPQARVVVLRLSESLAFMLVALGIYLLMWRVG